MSSPNIAKKFSNKKKNSDNVTNERKIRDSTKHTYSDGKSAILDSKTQSKVCSGVRRYNCIEEDCIASFATRQELREHSRTIHEAPVACPYDGCEIFVKLIDLAQHVETKHQNDDESNESDVNLEERIRDSSRCLSSFIGHGRNKYACEIKDCTLLFVTKLELCLHLHDVHKAPLRCPYKQCSKEFVSSSGLNIHIKTMHQYAIRKICENCGKDVQQRWLQKHILRCTSSVRVKTFKCTVKDCKSSFEFKEGLSVHIRTVHVAPKFCQNCKKMVSAQRFTSHTRRCTSTGEKRFSCPFKGCKAAFATFMGKTDHVRLIHKEPVKCPHKQCKKFVKPYRLGRHMKAVHGVSESKKQNPSVPEAHHEESTVTDVCLVTDL